MATVGTNFYRTISATITAADLAASLGWVALNLELTAGQQALITSIDLSVAVTGADYNNLQFVQAFIFRNINFDAALAANVQLGAGTESLYNQFTAFLSERVFHRDWNTPFPLQGPGRYAVYGQAFFGAFVGPAAYTLNVAGRVAPSDGGRQFPFVQR